MMKNSLKNQSLKKKRIDRHLEQVNLFAAGIDIGSQSHYVSVPEELAHDSVREFGCFTGDLNRMADGLVEMGIQTVAMESTGIYWIPAYEILEERGLSSTRGNHCSAHLYAPKRNTLAASVRSYSTHTEIMTADEFTTR
jgi:hypothetical protein